jgi:hypothetical protein
MPGHQAKRHPPHQLYPLQTGLVPLTEKSPVRTIKSVVPTKNSLSSNSGVGEGAERRVRGRAVRLNITALVLPFDIAEALVGGPWRSSGVSARGESAESSGVGQSESGRLPFVPVMKPAHLPDRDDAAIAWRRDRAMDGCVLVQRQAGAAPF